MATVFPNTEIHQEEATARPERGRELDLFAFVLVILRHLPFVAATMLLGFAFMAIKMIRTPSRFASTAVMIAPQSGPTASSLNAQLSLSAIDLVGRGSDLYPDILQSHTLEDRLIRDFNLQKVYGAEDLQTAENILTAQTTILAQRDGVVRVTVEDTNPQRAADLANDYLRQLDSLNSQLVLTSVGQERAYLEREMVREKDALADAEVALKQVEESTRGVTPDASASAGLGALETTRAQLRADQIRLAALLTGETEQNPEVVRLRTEIGGLASQVELQQRGTPTASTGTPTSQVPTQALVYTRRLRDVRFHETLFDLLARQFEQAKEQEARNPSVVEVLDNAVPSRHKSGPKRFYNSIIGGIAGALAGMFLVAAWIFLKSYFGQPVHAEKLREMFAAVRGRSRRG